jgi:hypothetical protein
MRLVKVAYILPNVESGGTERHVLALARRIDRSRFDLSLITTAGGGSLHGEFAALIPVTVFGDPRKGRRFGPGRWSICGRSPARRGSCAGIVRTSCTPTCPRRTSSGRLPHGWRASRG